ncbi:MAG: MFS transporter [Dehalococcoidia bacterium]|nr:MFS transporter [Dehalococcoidia bacterium]
MAASRQAHHLNEQPLPGRHVVFALLSASMLAYIMQFGMVSVSIGRLTTDLNAPLRWSGWVLTMFMIGQVIAMPVVGRISERVGAKNVFAIGFGLFGLASLACAVAPNVYLLIAARALQGAVGGGLQPAGTSLIGHVYGGGRMRAIGYYSSLMPFGAVLGPVVGGLIVDHFGWRWTFGFNVPLGLAVAVVAFLMLPDAGRRPQSGRIDSLGMGLLALAVTSLIFALTELGRRQGSPDPVLVGASLAISVAALAILVRHERRTASPIIDLDLLSRREFASLNILSFSFGMSWIGVASTIPLYAQNAYGFSVASSGTLLSPRAAVMVISSSVAAYFLPRTGFRKPMLVGMLGLVVTLVILGRGLHDPTFAGITIPNYTWLLIVVGSAGVFFGIANPSMNNAGIDLAPERIASIAGLRGMFMNLGGTIGIAFVVLIASRAENIGDGLDIAYTVLAAVLLLSLFALRAIPELSRSPRVAGPPVEEPVAAPAAGDA